MILIQARNQSVKVKKELREAHGKAGIIICRET